MRYAYLPTRMKTAICYCSNCGCDTRHDGTVCKFCGAREEDY